MSKSHYLPALPTFVIRLMVVVGLLFVVSSCDPVERSSDVAASESSNSTPAEWYTVAEWSGSGIKTTETFNVPSRDWRVHWETSNEAFAGAGIFQIYVYDSSDNLVTLAANKQGTGSDVSNVKPRGSFYLTINSGNVEWSVRVEAQR
jgi:hypothetical protein